MLSSMPSLNSAGETIRGYLFNKKFIIYLVLVALFIGIAFYVYNSYVAPKLNPDFVPNREFTDAETDGSVAEIYFFAVDWCP